MVKISLFLSVKCVADGVSRAGGAGLATGVGRTAVLGSSVPLGPSGKKRHGGYQRKEKGLDKEDLAGRGVFLMVALGLCAALAPACYGLDYPCRRPR